MLKFKSNKKAKKEYPELQKQLGENLQKIRAVKKLSLRAMAANCDLDDSNISKIENGKYNAQLSTIVELPKGLEVEPRDLLEYLSR